MSDMVKMSVCVKISKITAYFFVFILFLVSQACVAFEPNISLEVNFGPFDKTPQQQAVHRPSAVSERYLYNQSLQQSCHSKQFLDVHAANQLAQRCVYSNCSNIISDWYELSVLYQEYDCGESAHLQRRCDALEEVATQGMHHVQHSYALDDNVCDVLRSHGHDSTAYTTCYGNQFQQVLHQECIELLIQTAAVPVESPIYIHQEALVDCIDAVRGYNQEGLGYKASVVADFCWALLDYGSAVAEGAACGLIGAVQDVIKHPIQTAACVVAGQYILAYQLCKLLCNVADIGITALHNPSRAKEKWHDYIEPINNLISTIKSKEVTCRDALKAGTAITVGLIAQHKLLGGLNKLYNTTKNTALAFAKNNLSLKPQQYMQTSDGMIMKAVHDMQGLGSTVKEGIKDARILLEAVHMSLMQSLEHEIIVLRTIFDNKIKGFGECAHKYIKTDYEHILGMDLQFSRRGVPQVGGFHHDLMGMTEKSGIFEFANKVIDKTGYYKAELLYAGELVKEITFFPAYWSREKVISKIHEAYDNFIKSGVKITLEKDGKYIVNGLTTEGIEIEIYITQKGKITTAYPILK